MTAPRPFIVSVTGSECTGKTTLARALAAAFDAPWSGEFARAYVDAKQAVLDANDVEPIARGQLDGQLAAEAEAARCGRRLVVRDTDLASTSVYSRHYYGLCPDWVEAAAREHRADLYLLLRPDVPWVADGLARDRPDEEVRAEIHRLFREKVQDIGSPWVEIGGTWESRTARALQEVTRALASFDSTRRSPAGRPPRIP
jgi:NadR type nicotinamide-nucleotide adenylyltransferase